MSNSATGYQQCVFVISTKLKGMADNSEANGMRQTHIITRLCNR